MKRKKSIKQKMTEMAYEKPSLERKLTTIQKSMKEVNDILNGKK